MATGIPVGIGEEDEKNLEYSRDGISFEGDDTNNCSTFVEYYAFLKANSTLGKVCDLHWRLRI